MVVEAERCAPVETGGMLLGYCSPDTEPEQVMVEAVVGPGPDATHARQRFEPVWQEARLAEAYEASGRITTYLGDWHTHPEGPPKTSRLDRRTARRISRATAARMPRPLMLILGTHPSQAGEWVAVMYRWHSHRLEPVAVQVLKGS